MTLPAPEPDFIDRDPEKIRLDVIRDYEALTGRPLQPHQPEWQELQTWAYRETLLRIGIHLAARQNLLAFSEFPVIDFLGEPVGTPRLPAQYARTTLRFSVAAPAGADVAILAGTRRSTEDDRAVFATDLDVAIKAGQTSVDVSATATATGTHTNGYLAGQLTKTVDALPDGVSCTNITTTGGGAAQETTERYRDRIRAAPVAPSTAGSEEGYRLHALSASQAIEDVAVLAAGGNLVRVVLLDDDGSADELIPLVEVKLSDEKTRPLTDVVQVEASDVVDWELEAELTLYADADPETTLAAALVAADEYRASRRKLGREVDRGQVLAKLIVPGVHSCNLISPAANVAVAGDEWARCTSLQVTAPNVSSESMQ